MENTFKTPIHQIYGIENLGNGYFDVNALGHLVVKPKRGAQAVDVFQVVEEVRKRHRLHPPILLRFPQILETQVKQLCEAFQSASAELQYGDTDQGVFPIKVKHRRAGVAAGRWDGCRTARRGLGGGCGGVRRPRPGRCSRRRCPR